jgi:hypothetical protein
MKTAMTLALSTLAVLALGVVEGRDGRPSVFTLSLGADGADGSVLFTRTNGGRLFPGTYDAWIEAYAALATIMRGAAASAERAA